VVNVHPLSESVRIFFIHTEITERNLGYLFYSSTIILIISLGRLLIFIGRDSEMTCHVFV